MQPNQIHIVQRLAPGGIEQLVASLTRNADGAIGVFSLEGDMPELEAGWPALGDVAGNAQAFAKPAGIHPGTVLSLARAMRRLRPASIVTHHIGPLLYGGLAARLAGVQVHVHVEHDAWHYQDEKARRNASLALALCKPRLAAVSPLVAREVNARLGRRPEIISNGVDMALYRPGDRTKARARLGIPPNVRLIGAAGRLEPVKGFDLMVSALPNLPQDVIMIIFGAGSELSRLKAQAERLKVSSRVIFAGLSSDMASVYPAFDLFCLPSRAEGLPLAVLEAQACGIRVVAHDVGGVSEAVCPRTGHVIEPIGGERLAAALHDALADPSGHSPRTFVEARYPLKATLAAYANAAGRQS